jgi:hypothetical protein
MNTKVNNDESQCNKKTQMMTNFANLSLFVAHQYDLEDDNEHGWPIIVFCGIYTK